MTLHDSLQSAAKTAVAHGNVVSDIILARWAQTFRCNESDVEAAFRIAQNGGRKLPEETAASAITPPDVAEIEE